MAPKRRLGLLKSCQKVVGGPGDGLPDVVARKTRAPASSTSPGNVPEYAGEIVQWMPARSERLGRRLELVLGHVSERGKRLVDVLVDRVAHCSIPRRRERLAGDSSACARTERTSRSSRASLPLAYGGEASIPSASASASAPMTRSDPLRRRSARKPVTATVSGSPFFSPAIEGNLATARWDRAGRRLLARGFHARGHDVTLFAPEGSRSEADVVSPLPAPGPSAIGD